MAKILVQAIIYNTEKQILLTKSNISQVWQLPGGNLQKEETPWQGIIRDVLHETGLTIKINHLLGVYSKPENAEILFIFVCDIIVDQLIKITNTRQNSFFTIDHLPSNIHPYHKERLLDGLNQIDKPVFKIQEHNQSIDLVHLISKE